MIKFFSNHRNTTAIAPMSLPIDSVYILHITHEILHMCPYVTY